MEGMLFLFGLYWGSLERAADGDHGGQFRPCLVPPPVSAGGKRTSRWSAWMQDAGGSRASTSLPSRCFARFASAAALRCTTRLCCWKVLPARLSPPSPHFIPLDACLPQASQYAASGPRCIPCVREPSLGEQCAQARQVRAGPRGARAGPLGKAGHRLHVQTTGTQPWELGSWVLFRKHALWRGS